MISAGDFRNGVTVEIDGNVCQIVEFQHVKPGKGAAAGAFAFGLYPGERDLPPAH